MITGVSGDLSLVTPLSEPFSWDVVVGEPVRVDAADVDDVEDAIAPAKSAVDDKDEAMLPPKEPTKQYHRNQV